MRWMCPILKTMKLQLHQEILGAPLCHLTPGPLCPLKLTSVELVESVGGDIPPVLGVRQPLVGAATLVFGAPDTGLGLLQLVVPLHQLTEPLHSGLHLLLTLPQLHFSQPLQELICGDGAGVQTPATDS